MRWDASCFDLIFFSHMNKPEMRKKLAGLSFSEKIKILEKLRDRSLAIAASGLRSNPANYGRSDSQSSRSK